MQKILLTNDRGRNGSAVVELYDRRWRIELSLKELKSTPGFARDRFRSFDAVAGWTPVCLVAFVDLEWRRAKQLKRRGLSKPERGVWESERSFGGVQAVRAWGEQYDLGKLQDGWATPTGRKRVRRRVRAAHPVECRVRA